MVKQAFGPIGMNGARMLLATWLHVESMWKNDSRYEVKGTQLGVS